MRTAPNAAGPVVDVLNSLHLTDTVFHDLEHSSRLAAEVLARIPDAARTVLLLGPNVALAHVLGRSRDVTLWHINGVAVTEDLVERVERRGSVDELLELPGPGRRFDVVVAPYVVELASSPPIATLQSLADLVADDGALILVDRRAGGLQARADGLLGRAPLGRPPSPRAAPNWSWPSGPVCHVVDESLLTGWSRTAGLRILESRPVLDREPVERVSAVPLNEWLLAKARHAVKKAVPELRDTLVATLRPMRTGRPVAELGGDRQAYPLTSVVVFAMDADAFAAIVADLENQTYPRERTELVVVAPRALAGRIDVPGSLHRTEVLVDWPVPSAAAANEAVAACTGDVIAFTGDSCDVPPGWVESGVRALGNWTMAVSGRVLVQVQSAAAFLELPGRRRYPRPDGLFSFANSFYVRRPLLEVGGFEDPANTTRAAGPTWGWDTTAAVKLARSGYHVAESNQVYLHRTFPPAPDRRWMRQEYEYARGIPVGIRWETGLRRRALHRRWFASNRTFAFDALLGGVTVSLLTRRRLPAMLGALAYGRSVSEYVDMWPPSAWRTTARHLRGVVMRSALWAAGLARGSVAARRVVL